MEPTEETEYPKPSPEQIIKATMSALSARVAMSRKPFYAMLGIALPNGMACIDLPHGFDREVARKHVCGLAEERPVLGFSFVSISDTYEAKGAPGEMSRGSIGANNGIGDDALARQMEVVVVSLTRESRRISIFSTEMISGRGLKVSDEPRLTTNVFMSTLFDGLWEVMQ